MVASGMVHVRSVAVMIASMSGRFRMRAKAAIGAGPVVRRATTFNL